MKTNRNVLRCAIPLYLKLLTVGLCIPITAYAQPNTSGAAAGDESDPGDSHVPKIPELQEMISKALKSHPEVRAAQAQLLGAQANLDRVRLEVAHKIVDHQKLRQALELRLKTEESKLIEVQEVNRRAPGSVPPSSMQALKATVDEIRLELAGVRTQLPFILGQTATETPTQIASVNEREFAEQMVAHARTGYGSAVALREGGIVMQDFVVLWSKRLMEAEELRSGESTAIAERHLARMQSLLDIAKAGFEGGVATQMDYAAAQYSVAEAKLLLKRRK